MPVNSSLHRTFNFPNIPSHLINCMFVFINISSNISSPETVSLYNIDDMYIDGMLLTLTQIILDFVTLLIPAIHCPIEHFMCMRIMDFLSYVL